MLRRLLDTLRKRSKPPATPAPSADYAGDREADRAGRLGAEDRAWEAASQQRSRDAAARQAADAEGADRP